MDEENVSNNKAQDWLPSISYIAKIAEGGMRDAITLMDKCLAYSQELTLENVVKALGTTDYETMFKLTDTLVETDTKNAITIIENLYNEGKDLKQFIHSYCHFLLDLCKLNIGCGWELVSIPKLPDYEQYLKDMDEYSFNVVSVWMRRLLKLDNDIKYSATPKLDIECTLYRGMVVDE